MTTEKTVYIVRHGQTDANITPVFQATDSPLNEAGRGQAKKIAERINNIDFDLLVSSSLLRTRETARFIEEVTGKTPEYSDLFVELIKPKSAEGKSRDDKEVSDLYEKWQESLHRSGVKVEDGENFDELMERADNALDFLKNKEEEDIVVVTHGMFLRALIFRAMLQESLTPELFGPLLLRAKTANTGISVLKYGETSRGVGWYLFVYNDHAHLG